MKWKPPDVLVGGLVVLLIIIFVSIMITRMSEGVSIDESKIEMILGFAATIVTGVLLYAQNRNKKK